MLIPVKDDVVEGWGGVVIGTETVIEGWRDIGDGGTTV